MKKFLLYMYVFFIIYTPPFLDLYFGIPNQIVLFILLICTGSYVLVLNYKESIKVNKVILILIIGIIVSATYFTVRASIDNSDLRILQNLFVIIQILHILVVIKIAKKLKFNKEGILKVFFNLAVFQAIISVIMLIVPEFKNIALQLYYLGREENEFISRMRIYGISGDYTFFTPIYHGILAFLVTILALFIRYKYIYYLPFLLLIILLNGRYGLIVYGVGIAFFTFYLLLKGKVPKKIYSFIGTILIGVPPLMMLMYYKANPTFTWIMGGIEDTLVFITTRELQGNYKALAGSHVFFPEGLSLIWGEGHRVFGLEGPLRGYNTSDIGYVNDMFMGGAIYILLLYGIIIWFVLKDINKYDFIVKGIFFSLVVMILVANYKGEVMRGGLVLMEILFVSLILKDKNFKDWNSMI